MVSMGKMARGNETHVFVTGIRVIEETFDAANAILSRMHDWKDLVFHSQESLAFPEDCSYAMLASVGYSRRKMPAFNTIFYGETAMGKTTVIRYYVETMMKGQHIDATASSGKKWLVSHKEGVAESVMFSQRDALLVDEAFKSAIQEAGKDRSGVFAM